MSESQYEMFKRNELPSGALEQIRKHADARGIIWFATPTSEVGIQDLVDQHVPLLKNGSDYLGNLPLIRAMAISGVPAVFSTGMATLAEIDDAVRAFRRREVPISFYSIARRATRRRQKTCICENCPRSHRLLVVPSA